MKRITTLLLAVLLMASCSKGSDDIVNVELEGKWELTNAFCFCFFDPDTDFSVHGISFEGSMLTVTNSEELRFLGASGTYSYAADGNLITLENGNQYRYVIEDNVLRLTYVDNPDIADDELVLEYIRD
ncbi:copper resistance protein NlpE [Flavobacteriaceae bacterium TP-CH-4]|uniref:Copper resistance protein NlpE n=1 Tax=Pelagihabitans pacificus TaxID=2696054 RepID=A0A967ASA4_9FLAO|nr:hypothetical protein [Pelagihabitans pacificus]NHF58550.1 copper resistance protein NlpE [Pelagihabitans pacificus]